MKQCYTLFLTLLLFPIVIWGSVPLKPLPEYANIAKHLSVMLPAKHISQAPFDDEMSIKAWTNLVNSLDFDRTMFTQEDLAKYEVNKTLIDDQIKVGDLSLGYDLVNLIRERLEQRYTFVTNALAEPFDFTVDETYLWKRKDAVRPKNREAQEKLWYAYLKNEMLAQILTRELDEKEDAQKAELKKTNQFTQVKPLQVKPFTPPLSEEEQVKADRIARTKALLEEEDLNLTPQERIKKRYRTYLDAYVEMDSETALQYFLSAVSNTYDPHTDYMSPMIFEEFNMGMNLSLHGIGASLRYDDGMLKIMEIMPGSPAERDMREIRLIEGDRIIGVAQGDGPMEDIMHKPMNRTIRKIRGPKGSKVLLKVIPASDKAGVTSKLVDLIRDEIKLEEQAVTGHVHQVTLSTNNVRKLGYVRIPTFYASMGEPLASSKFRSMTKDLVKYIASFNAQRVDGLIVDLRNNGGGSLIEAVQMTSLFACGPVVQVKDASRIQMINAPRIDESLAFRKPMIVLINRRSASASEIVAGALKDYGRAIIIGDTSTYGKGTVQTVLPLGSKRDGSEKITTAGFYRINGESTQLRGVTPDIVISSFYDALEMGEKTLPNAPPWTRIPAAYYAKISDVSPFIGPLTEKAKVRLAKDEEYNNAQKLIAHIKELNAQKTVSLERTKRLTMMTKERALRKIEEDELLPPRLQSHELREKKDYVLRESFNILSDYIDLRGGPHVPFDTNGNLNSRIFNLFGN